MANGGAAVYWKGVRCWQFAKCLRAQPQRGGASGKVGVSRKRGRLNSRSPNVLYQIMVPAWMPSVSGDHVDSVSALTGAGRQVTRQIYISRTLEFFVDNSGGANGLGRLAWVQDVDEELNVTVGGSGPALTLTYTGSGFTPAVGDLVVVRHPTTGAGFCTAVIGIGSGTINVDAVEYSPERDPATGEPLTMNVTVASGWKILKAQYYYDRAEFITMIDQEVPTQVEDKVVMDIRYQFQSEGGIVYPATMTPAF